MPRKSFEVSVEPAVLIWARESMSFSRADVAKHFDVTEDLVSRWESGGKRPTIKQLEKLATKYKRPLAAFFLPAAPTELPLPPDYRSFPTDTKPPLSPKTLLAIRRARRLQSLASELARSLDREITVTTGRISLSQDPESVAENVRERLAIGIEAQLEWGGEYDALNNWREAVEGSGVLVSQMAMPLEKERIRAFSLTEPEPPIIVLNSQDAVTARIFSLFHEYAHVLLGNSGICNMGEADEQTEIFCNHFAGAFLVPEEDLVAHELTRALMSSISSPDRLDETLYQLAKGFKVSQEVVLRRTVILGLVQRSVYDEKREEWEVKEWQHKRTGGGGRDMARECTRKNGRRFVSLVLDAHREERITYSDVADYLGVRTKHLSDIERLVGSKG